MPRDELGYWHPEKGTGPPQSFVCLTTQASRSFQIPVWLPGLSVSLEYDLFWYRHRHLALIPAGLVPLCHFQTRLDPGNVCPQPCAAGRNL